MEKLYKAKYTFTDGTKANIPNLYITRSGECFTLVKSNYKLYLDKFLELYGQDELDLIVSLSGRKGVNQLTPITLTKLHKQRYHEHFTLTSLFRLTGMLSKGQKVQHKLTKRRLTYDYDKYGEFQAASLVTNEAGSTFVKKFSLPRLMYSTFIGFNPDDAERFVAHIDNNKRNNHIDNLYIHERRSRGQKGQHNDFKLMNGDDMLDYA